MKFSLQEVPDEAACGRALLAQRVQFCFEWEQKCDQQSDAFRHGLPVWGRTVTYLELYPSIYSHVKRNRHRSWCVVSSYPPMRPRKPTRPTAALNIQNLPRSTFYRLKMAAAAEEKSVTDLVTELIEHKIRELEAKGLLPRGK